VCVVTARCGVSCSRVPVSLVYVRLARRPVLPVHPGVPEDPTLTRINCQRIGIARSRVMPDGDRRRTPIGDDVTDGKRLERPSRSGDPEFQGYVRRWNLATVANARPHRCKFPWEFRHPVVIRSRFRTLVTCRDCVAPVCANRCVFWRNRGKY